MNPVCDRFITSLCGSSIGVGWPPSLDLSDLADVDLAKLFDVVIRGLYFSVNRNEAIRSIDELTTTLCVLSIRSDRQVV